MTNCSELDNGIAHVMWWHTHQSFSRKETREASRQQNRVRIMCCITCSILIYKYVRYLHVAVSIARCSFPFLVVRILSLFSRNHFSFLAHTNKQQSGSGRRGLKAGTKTETVRRRLCVNKADGIEADEVISSGKGKAGKSGSRRRERELSGKGKGGSSSDGMFGRADDDSCLCIETEEVINWADGVSSSGKSGKSGKSGSSGMDIDGRVDADEISSSGKSGKSGNSRRERRLSGKGKGGKVSIQ